jgi:hypothetical protein
MMMDNVTIGENMMMGPIVFYKFCLRKSFSSIILSNLKNSCHGMNVKAPIVIYDNRLFEGN